MDNLVQFEEDFNSGTKKLSGGPVGLSQTSPIPRSPDGDKNWRLGSLLGPSCGQFLQRLLVLHTATER